MFTYGEMHEKRREIHKCHRLGRMEPIKITDNVYFVGTYQASSHIIDTGEGLIMFDTGYAETAYLLVDSIYRLGYRPEDIKYIVNTHWHHDHTAATADIAALSGAKTLIARDDAEKAKAFFDADILIDDKDTLTLGNTTVEFLVTPGHTKGTLSFFFDTTDGGKVLRAGSFGGTGLNTLALGTFEFENAREAFFASIERLKGEKVDVFLGNHTWNNGTWHKGQLALESEKNPFVDSELWHKFLEKRKQDLVDLINRENSNGKE